MYTILWQWGGASVAGDRGIYGCRSAGTGRVWCGNGSGCETDDFYTGNCCCDPLFLRADGRAVVVSACVDVKRILREKIYEKMLKLGASYSEQVSSSEVVQVSTEGVEQLETYFGKYLPQLFYSLIAPLTLFQRSSAG